MKKIFYACLSFCLILSLLQPSQASQLSENNTYDNFSLREISVAGAMINNESQERELLILTPQYSTNDMKDGHIIQENLNGSVLNSRAVQAITTQAIIDYTLGVVTITGKLPGGRKDKVTVLVLRPGYTIEEVAEMDEIELVNAVEYINQISSAEDGSFRFEYALNLQNVIENQNYSVRTGTTNIGLDEQGKSDFKYFGQSAIVSVINEIKNATVEKIAAMFLDYDDNPYLINGNIYLNDILLLNLSDYRNLAEKKPVHEALAGKDFTASGINGIREAFINAVEKQKNVEQDRVLENQAINAINNATVDTMAQVLEDYNSVLKLDLLNEYGYKMLLNKKLAGTSNAIDYLYNAIIGQNTLDAIRDIFEQQVAIQAINCADWQEINEVINSNNAVLKLNLSGDYANLIMMIK